jgi:hypothetical protein
LGVAYFGRFEVEYYGGVVEMQSEHLTDQVADDLAQSLPVWTPLCLDGSACRYHSPRRKVFPTLEAVYAHRLFFGSAISLSAISPGYEQQGCLTSSRGGCETRSEELVCDGRGRQPHPNNQVVPLTLAVSESCSAVGTLRCAAWECRATVCAELSHCRSH